MQTVTDLETSCAAINKLSVYANGHCYTISSTTMNYNDAKLSCNDVDGINGHLIHPKDPSQIEIIRQFMNVSEIEAHQSTLIAYYIVEC